ncbi:MAG: hypothetical protein H7844_13020 [Nitrospirae bacterium YQR-1]
MSEKTREILHYILRLKTGDIKTPVIQTEIINTCMNELMNRVPGERLLIRKNNNRFHFLKDYRSESHYGLGYFISAKYNHMPDLISLETLKTRPNPKEPNEGEAEKTHFALGLGETEAYLILEKKHGGISIGLIKEFIENQLNIIFKNNNKFGKHYFLSYQLLVAGDFLSNLNKMKTIRVAEIYTPSEILTDTFVSDAIIPAEIKDNIIITLSAKKKGTLSFIEKIHSTHFGKNDKIISRLRVRGKTEDNANMVLDTDRIIEKIKIEVELDENGQVVTESIFPQLATIIRGMI